ncbi:putative receptor-like protein kinase At5g39000 [Populus nigra]|uniref:putative receptor-like protein kinase At5g39000 n=1 Tax=Populus nigra TaxID=3691 RepID=UPI002B26BBFE|nr:putative receptor-like protein kinase At5g39000 [Populus nigra]
MHRFSYSNLFHKRNSIMSIFIALYLLPPLHLFLYVTATTDYLQRYSPTDLILLNCGASSNLSSPDGRGWDGDSQSKFAASNPPEASSVFAASNQDPSVNQVPYMTARIFHSKFTYTFPVLPGPKFVRLYFYPASYSNLDISTSYFSLSANNYELLNNFSASLTVPAIRPPVDYFTKEFIITVWDNQKLELTFIPSPASFAFINGIEIVSMPDSFYARGSDNPLTNVGTDLSYLDNTTALETVYRLNVGGQDISSTGDTGMYRTWHQDSEYLLGGRTGNTPYLPGVKIEYTTKTPAYSAPAMVYSTMRSMGPEPRVNMNYNLTWIFPVDADFHYLLRLHFCEFRMEFKSVNQQVFLIFINNQTAEYDADVIHMSGGNGIPVYKDYIVLVPQGSQSKQDLWLELHPNMELKPTYADAILNGLEIFKLNTTDGNLAGFNPDPTVAPPPAEQHPSLQERRTGKRSSILTVIGIVGGSIGAVFACSLILYFFAFKQKRVKDPSKSEEKSSWTLLSQTSRSTTTISPSLPTDLCRRFTFFEINEATGNFDDQNIIGSGGFGTVYKGYIEYGFIAVAIKRLDSSSKQGTREFQTEIEMLSNLRHLHLVSLIGYCDDHGEMILVYDYMSRGTLREHLYKTKSSPLPWKQRLEICIGAAKGLHYLHSGAKHTIIHRDVKSTNILLDENWVAKVSDFGLSRLGPTSTSQTHVSTVVRGSIGYVDPEYYRRQHLTEKSDVYSFGVVLFEVLCARPPVIPSSPKDQASLADWARKCYHRGTLDQIVDPHLKGEVAPASLNKFAEIANSCLHGQGIERPKMGDVVWGLEFALQVQQTAENNANNMENKSSFSPRQDVMTTDDDDMFSGAESHSRSTVSTRESVTQSDPDQRARGVFSEIIDPKAR